MTNKQPDTNTLEGKIAVMEASKTKKIQFKRKSRSWVVLDDIYEGNGNLAWNWGDYDYRIHPEDLNPAQFRPYNFDEVIVGSILRSKEHKNWITIITSKFENKVVLGGHSLPFSLQDLFDKFVIEANNQPCGIKI